MLITRRAFTLVEMLIVLCVVGIFAALLFPLFKSARNAARRTTCASNLRQIGQALQLYVQDYRFYPILSNNGNEDCSLWADRVYTYTKSAAVFACPEAERGEFQPGCPPSENRSQKNEVRFDGSYDLNVPAGSFTVDATGAPTLSYFPRQAASPTRYTRASSTILVLDGDGYFVNPGYQQPLFQGTQGLLNYGVNSHHNNGCVLCFADGHVKWLSLESMTKRSLWIINGPE